jgi:hypothetical protein
MEDWLVMEYELVVLLNRLENKLDMLLAKAYPELVKKTEERKE